MKVVAPVPWFPLASSHFPKYSVFARVPKSETRHAIDIEHPRYAVIPKLSMSIAPFLLAVALVRLLHRIIRQGYDFDILDAYYFYPDGVAAMILGRRFSETGDHLRAWHRHQSVPKISNSAPPHRLGSRIVQPE